KKVHEMIEAYKLIEHEEAKALTEKVFSYQQVLEKLVFVNQLSPTSRFYLLDFYYENCAPCLKSISYLKNLEHDFSSATLSVIAVNPYDTKEKIENYAVKNQISYAEAMIDKEFVDDSIGHIGYPFFVLFDREGKIVLKQTGFDPAFFDKVREIINK
ncbi:MAG: TlpA disulfide reductase family protein, partial [Saprospiraceae bacterium]